MDGRNNRNSGGGRSGAAVAVYVAGGLVFGVAIGLVLDSLALGAVVGIIVGLALGVGFDGRSRG